MVRYKEILALTLMTLFIVSCVTRKENNLRLYADSSEVDSLSHDSLGFKGGSMLVTNEERAFYDSTLYLFLEETSTIGSVSTLMPDTMKFGLSKIDSIAIKPIKIDILLVEAPVIKDAIVNRRDSVRNPISKVDSVVINNPPIIPKTRNTDSLVVDREAKRVNGFIASKLDSIPKPYVSSTDVISQNDSLPLTDSVVLRKNVSIDSILINKKMNSRSSIILSQPSTIATMNTGLDSLATLSEVDSTLNAMDVDGLLQRNSTYQKKGEPITIQNFNTYNINGDTAYGSDKVLLSKISALEEKMNVLNAAFIAFKSKENASDRITTSSTIKTPATSESTKLLFDEAFYFDLGSTRPQISIAKKNSLLKLLENGKATSITLSSFTDKSGGAQLNLELSRKRVEIVRLYLIGLGFDAKIIFIQYFGEAYPSVNVANERRVECRVAG